MKRNKMDYDFSGRYARQVAKEEAATDEVDEAIVARERDATEYRATRERKFFAIARIRQEREAQHEEAVFVNWLMARSI
jgi:hypothetical protein